MHRLWFLPFFLCVCVCVCVCVCLTLLCGMQDLSFLNRDNLYPLQLFLREILINSRMDTSGVTDPEMLEAMQGLADSLKYVVIVVSTFPLMCIYPFVQKYFEKGLMAGAVKG